MTIRKLILAMRLHSDHIRVCSANLCAPRVSALAFVLRYPELRTNNLQLITLNVPAPHLARHHSRHGPDWRVLRARPPQKHPRAAHLRVGPRRSCFRGANPRPTRPNFLRVSRPPSPQPRFYAHPPSPPRAP